MQQEVGGRMEQMNGLQQQRQDRRVKPPGSENQQPHQPQKCPRCESLNTKFCYYNNYSLTQPRYFCKTCRRYWTQGGTLRNVPVGGGCRKGKRSKRPSTAENQNLKQQLVSVSAATASNATVVPKAETDVIMGSSNPIPSMAPASSSMYYPGGGGGGGFLSSLATLQPFNQAMNLGGDFGGSNLALLQGFGLPSLQQHLQQSQVFDMDDRGTNPSQVFPQAENIIQGSGDSRTTSHHQDWNQSFIKSEPAYWANNNRDSNNTGGDGGGGGGGGGSSIRSQSWMSDPGYDPSSQPFL